MGTCWLGLQSTSQNSQNRVTQWTAKRPDLSTDDTVSIILFNCFMIFEIISCTTSNNGESLFSPANTAILSKQSSVDGGGLLFSRPVSSSASAKAASDVLLNLICISRSCSETLIRIQEHSLHCNHEHCH